MSGTTAFELPAYRIAVVQDESETLHNPTLDVMGALGDRERWRCQLFNGRTFDSLLAAQGEFDCIVLGPNVVYHNASIWTSIERVKVGLLMLHQLRLPKPVDPERPTLGLDVAKLDREGADYPVTGTPQRDFELELLLNWPETVEPKSLAARTACALEPAPESDWRRVIELEDGRPLLVRSPLTSSRRVAVCTLLLESGHEAHRRLLRNMVAFCAAGPPRAVALPDESAPWASTLARKMRLRGVSAVECDPETTKLDFECWPLRTAADVIVPKGLRELPGQAEWLKRGGRLTAVDASSGELHVLYRAPDAHWVARAWSAWVQAGRADKRLTSVMAARAYHRTLQALGQALGGELGRYGLREPAQHADELRKLAEERLKSHDNLEETIAPTAALLELGQLVPGSIDAEIMERVEGWLRGVVGKAGPEDQLEISRVLCERAMLETALPNLSRPLLASAIVRVRRAALVCDALDLPLPLDEADRELMLAEIGSSVLNAAEYLSSLAAVRAARGAADAALGTDDGRLADAAIEGLLRHGALNAMSSSASGTAEEVCAEALALIAYLGLDDVPTSVLVGSESVPPAPFVEDALREGSKIRDANSAYRATNERLTEQLNQTNDRLNLASGLLGVTVAVVAICAAGLASWLGVEVAPSGALEFLSGFLVPFAVATIVIAALGIPLARKGLCPPWLVKLGTTVGGGVDGVKEFALGLLGQATSTSATSSSATTAAKQDDKPEGREGDAEQ